MRCNTPVLLVYNALFDNLLELLKNISKVRKSIIAKKNIKKNELFSEKNLCSKRPGTGLSPMLWDEIIGKKATRNYKIDDFIKLD